MQFDWLNQLVRRFTWRNEAPRTRGEALGVMALLAAMSVMALGIGFMVIAAFMEFPVFMVIIALVVGLVYFLSTKVQLRGDGDES